MHRHLLPAALMLCLLVNGAMAQTPPGDAVRGKPLFENTRVATGNNNIANCTSCHTDGVQGRRIAISLNTGGTADPYADIGFETAMTRFTQAMTGRAEMRQFYGVLTAQQVSDIAAFLADTPKTDPASETQINLTAALNGNSPARTVTLTHSRTAAESLSVKGVTLEGSGAAQFHVGSAAVSCLANSVLAAAGSCAVTVTYAPTGGGVADADLVFRMSQGTSGDFYRVLPLHGVVTGGSSGDSGGGALGLGWLLALAAAVAGLSAARPFRRR